MSLAGGKGLAAHVVGDGRSGAQLALGQRTCGSTWADQCSDGRATSSRGRGSRLNEARGSKRLRQDACAAHVPAGAWFKVWRVCSVLIVRPAHAGFIVDCMGRQVDEDVWEVNPSIH
jgi:hypothetical protein